MKEMQKDVVKEKPLVEWKVVLMADWMVAKKVGSMVARWESWMDVTTAPRRVPLTAVLTDEGRVDVKVDV